MGRPEGTEKSDSSALIDMASLVVLNKATSPWNAACMVSSHGWAPGNAASQEAFTKRIYRKYKNNPEHWESLAMALKTLFDDPVRWQEIEEQNIAIKNRLDEIRRLNHLVENDTHVMGLIERIKSNPEKLQELLPVILLYSRKWF